MIRIHRGIHYRSMVSHHLCNVDNSSIHRAILLNNSMVVHAATPRRAILLNNNRGSSNNNQVRAVALCLDRATFHRIHLEKDQIILLLRSSIINNNRVVPQGRHHPSKVNGVELFLRRDIIDFQASHSSWDKDNNNNSSNRVCNSRVK